MARTEIDLNPITQITTDAIGAPGVLLLDLAESRADDLVVDAVAGDAGVLLRQRRGRAFGRLGGRRRGGCGRRGARRLGRVGPVLRASVSIVRPCT